MPSFAQRAVGCRHIASIVSINSRHRHDTSGKYFLSDEGSLVAEPFAGAFGIWGGYRSLRIPEMTKSIGAVTDKGQRENT